MILAHPTTPIPLPLAKKFFSETKYDKLYENKPNLHSESEIKNYVLNSDIFLNNLIAWSTKQSEDSETILNINNEIEKFENTIYETNLSKIIQ